MSTESHPLFTQISTLSGTFEQEHAEGLFRSGTETVAFALASNGAQVVVTTIRTIGNDVTHAHACVKSLSNARTLYASLLSDGFTPVRP